MVLVVCVHGDSYFVELLSRGVTTWGPKVNKRENKRETNRARPTPQTRKNGRCQEAGDNGGQDSDGTRKDKHAEVT